MSVITANGKHSITNFTHPVEMGRRAALVRGRPGRRYIGGRGGVCGPVCVPAADPTAVARLSPQGECTGLSRPDEDFVLHFQWLFNILENIWSLLILSLYLSTYYFISLYLKRNMSCVYFISFKHNKFLIHDITNRQSLGNLNDSYIEYLYLPQAEWVAQNSTERHVRRQDGPGSPGARGDVLREGLRHLTFLQHRRRGSQERPRTKRQITDPAKRWQMTPEYYSAFGWNGVLIWWSWTRPRGMGRMK